LVWNLNAQFSVFLCFFFLLLVVAVAGVVTEATWKSLVLESEIPVLVDSAKADWADEELS
jgi:hypothetical protein